MLHSTVLKMNGQSKNMTVFLTSSNADIFRPFTQPPWHSVFEGQFISAAVGELVASLIEIADNTEAHC